MQRPLIHPYAYSVLILLFTVITTAVIILLLSLFCCYYCYKTVATNNLCRARLFPGVGEVTNYLLRLTNIFWLPLCRINKLGFTSHEDCCDPSCVFSVPNFRSCGPRCNHVVINLLSLASCCMLVHMYEMW